MLDNALYLQRRQQFLSKLPASSVALIPANNLVTRSNDTEYKFRQDSNFWYLTGFNEPDAYLLLSNQNNEFLDVLFCLPKDKQAEIWHGRRLGAEDAPSYLGVMQAFTTDVFAEKLEDFLDGTQYFFYSRRGTDKDSEIYDVLDKLMRAPKQSKNAPVHHSDPKSIFDEMRLFKDESEIKVMQQAADISVKAHQRAMQFCRPGVNEYQLEAEIHHEFAMSGAHSPAYGSIVGSGDNACILHYTENNCVVNDGDLVLIDAGAELQGYAADITRTFPANGKFSDEQRQLYDLVLAAQLASIELVCPGNTLKQVGDKAIEVLTEGLIELGLLSGTVDENIETKTYRDFYMHGIGHWLGLDVHDVGNYKIEGDDRPLEPGMTLTIEPGLYVAPDADVEEKWQGIGIRIEDNLLVTESGHAILTEALVKTADDIEALMAK